METYIALLRGINVGGHKKIKMAELKSALVDLGLKNVNTYIQSGNVIFQTDTNSIPKLEAKIERTILNNWGFEVPVIIKPVSYFKETVSSNPYLSQNISVDFLHYAIPKTKSEHTIKDTSDDEIRIEQNIIYLQCKTGYSKTKFTNTYLEKQLKTLFTTRNAKTINRLLHLADNPS